MKKTKNTIAALGLLGAGWIVAGYGCAASPNKSGSGGSSASSSGGSSSSSGGAHSSGGSGGSGGSSSGSGGSSNGSGGSGSSCELPSLSVFSRSDTSDSWDDNDFSEVTLDGTCPIVASVTWPHETDWENKDPSEANHEQVHFTIDSYYSSDLTGKQLNLEIELTGDKRGSSATAGGYIVSLVSVSTFDRVVTGSGGTSGSGGSDAGGASGSEGGAGGAAGAGTAGAGGEAGGGRAGGAGRGGGMGGRRGGGGRSGGAAGGNGGSAGGGSDGSAGAGGDGGSSGDGGAGGSGDTPMTVIGYSEAETPDGDRKTLSKVGDKVSMSFKLPNKGAAVDSYDPTRPVKINIRIYTVFTSSGSPTYDYMTSQLTIRKFEVTDAK